MGHRSSHQHLPPPFLSWSHNLDLPRQLAPELVLERREGGRPLPLSASRRLLGRMSRRGLSTVDVMALRRICRDDSLERFAATLFEAWLGAGEPEGGRWAFQGLVALGTDETIRRLARQVRAWSQEGRHRWCARAVEVMRRDGSDLALLHLLHLSRRAKRFELRREADQAIGRVADDRRQPLSEVLDEVLPDLGLDESGRRRLELGGRSVTVRLDQLLQPELLDESGRSLEGRFPTRRKGDDPERYLHAKATFRQLRSEAELVAATQLERFERALCQGTRWRGDDFLTDVARHPMLRAVAQRLLWAILDDSGRPDLLFRVAEDGTLSDVDDREVTLSPMTSVTLPHPMHLSAEAKARWQSLFADYKLVQPFPQLVREVHQWPEEGLETSTLEGCRGWQVPPARLVRLRDRGWSELYSGGAVRALVRRQGRFHVQLPFSPGFRYSELKTASPMTLSPLCLTSHRPRLRLQIDDEPPRPWFSDLDPQLRSELWRDLESLRG